MADDQSTSVTTGVRGRVVARAVEKINAKQPELPKEFLRELAALLSAAKVPKAEGFLQLFEKHAGGES